MSEKEDIKELMEIYRDLNTNDKTRTFYREFFKKEKSVHPARANNKRKIIKF